MPFKSKSQVKALFAKARRGEFPMSKAKEWAHKTKDIKGLPEKAPKKAALDILREATRDKTAQFYVELFKSAASSDIVNQVKTAGVLGQIFKHPGVAYGLGAAALGAGLPVAYGFGKQRAIEDAQRAGVAPPPVSAYPEDMFFMDPQSGYGDMGYGGGYSDAGYSDAGYGDQFGFSPEDALYGMGLDALTGGLY